MPPCLSRYLRCGAPPPRLVRRGRPADGRRHRDAGALRQGQARRHLAGDRVPALDAGDDRRRLPRRPPRHPSRHRRRPWPAQGRPRRSPGRRDRRRADRLRRDPAGGRRLPQARPRPEGHRVHAEALDGTTATDERCAILGRLHTGATQVVVNCGVLCLDAETEILTDRGWAGVNAMSYAHRVANWDNGRVFFERPLEIVCRDRLLGEDMAILETVRRSVRVTGGHRMLYRTAPRAPWRKVPARELVGKKAELPICGSAEPFAVTPEQPEPVDERQRRRLISATAYNLRKREGFEWEASFKEAARRTDRKLCLRRKTPSELTLEECSLIGFWVGAGSVNRPRRAGVEYTLAQSTSYPTIVDWVDEKIAATGLHAVRRTVPSRPN